MDARIDNHNNDKAKTDQGGNGGGSANEHDDGISPPTDGPSLKACHDCQRIHIGKNFTRVSGGRTFIGLFFVYAPIFVLPFVLLGACLVYVHLRMMGATNIKTLKDFLPDWKSHRYRYKTQIVKDATHPAAAWARLRAYWIFNCSLYCPFSVALLEWTTYLTKAVENWWCPFKHKMKDNYKNASLDYSYWHVSSDCAKLHVEDRDNPIWNHETARKN